MENNGYITAGELALWGKSNNSSSECDKSRHYASRGTADTALALGASGLAIAIFGGLALAYGLNSSSKARSAGNAATLAAQSKTMEILASTVNREAVRADNITVDVQQTLRSLTGQTQSALAQGGNASSQALATAEALALLNNSGNATGVNSAVGGCNYLRVARVSGSQLCGCDTCGS